MSDTLSHDELLRLLDYDRETGLFTWKVDLGTRAKAGQTAGYKAKDGYVRIVIHQQWYLAHRLAWFYVHGYFPEHGIDHIDRTPTHNRIDNLREVTQVCNMRNYGNRADNTSGVKGVYLEKRTGKWKAQIVVTQKVHNLGRFDDFDEAVCKRLAVEQCLGWSGCDSSSPAYQYVSSNIQQKEM